MSIHNLKITDWAIHTAVDREKNRQATGLELIPSENYVSDPVLTALGSVFTNKYAEGYPGKRYYGGQTYTDMIETIALNRVKKLFNAKYANVQPLSGAVANISMYFALLEPGDTVLGMELSHGGHLTHGHPVTYLSKIFKFERYGMKDVNTGEIDYDELRKIAKRVKPKILLAGFSSYPRSLNYDKFVSIAKEVGAIAVMDMAHIAGLIAGGALENPLDHGFDVLTSTTQKTLRGPRGGIILTNNEELAKKIDKSVFPGVQGGPHMNNVAAKAVSFLEASKPEFKKYAHQVIKNAKAMEEVFNARGVKMITGGTDNHMLLLDVWKDGAGITGQDAESALDSAGITVNKNVIPNDTRKPMDPSGIRLGTPAITTRGFTVPATKKLTHLICDILEAYKADDSVLDFAPAVKALTAEYPIPKLFIKTEN